MDQEREDHAEPDGQAEHDWRFDWRQALGDGGLFVILMCAAMFGVAGYAYARQFIPVP
jgi:hypothetical protein